MTRPLQSQAESLLFGILFLVTLIYQQSQDELKGGPGRSAANSLAVVVHMMAATVSAMLLFGVVKSRPSYLMPFFWIRLCDFFFSLPTFLSSLYANPAYSSHWDQTHGATPTGGFMDMRRVWPPGSGSGVAGSHSLLVATCIILFKGYFLCVVWKCYRYLKMREMILPLTLSFPASVVGPDLMMPPGFMPPAATAVTLSPPDYETATKGSSAPPDYETAIRQQDAKAPASPDSSPVPQSPSSSSTSESDQSQGSQRQTEASDATVIQVHVSDVPEQTEGRDADQEQIESDNRRVNDPTTRRSSVDVNVDVEARKADA